MNIINYLQNNLLFFAIFVGIFGLIIGSFLNVVIYRLPIMLKNTWQQECLEYLNLNQATPIPRKIFNLFIPRSHCPKCEKPIPFWANMPIVGFLILGGKCHACESIISWHYPVVELLSGLASFALAYHFGVTIQTIAVLILSWGLIALIFIDLDHMLLPDNLTFTLLWLGLLLNVTLNLFTTAENAILGAISGYISLWLVANIFKLIRKVEGMGHGDFKLFALFGAWFGWQVLPFIILGATLIGSIIGIIAILSKKHQFKKPLPFGPFLIVCGWLMIFYGETIITWYRTLITG